MSCLAVALAPRAARAAEEDPASPARSEAPFKGRGLFVSVGPGFVTNLEEATTNLRVLATFPVSEHLAVEPQVFATHLRTTSHHGKREGTTGAAIGVGLRYVPFPSWKVRPYAAARVAHLHFWPDPWGEHVEPGTTITSHTSHHRFGGGGALGFEAPLVGAFRLGLEGDALALSGPGANGFLQVQVVLGYAF